MRARARRRHARARLARVARRRRDNPCASPTRIASTFEDAEARDARETTSRDVSAREKVGCDPASARETVDLGARASFDDG